MHEEAPLRALPLNAVKERVSLARLELVVSAAGFHLRDPRADYDAIDVVIASSAEYEQYYAPSLETQMKCTTSPHVARRRTDGSLSFSLDGESYRKLSNPKRYSAALFVALVLPGTDDPAAWAVQTEDGLYSPGVLLWSNPKKWPPLPSAQKSGTVPLRTMDVLDVSQLQGIMKSVGDGGDW
ncbi:DUF4365 domain-containing protein [Streptomyces sp. AgN23]|nr:DUF4365 domain-containing protein [Streptomyces sp. AgN23]